jgi:hypothetical protein
MSAQLSTATKLFHSKRFMKRPSLERLAKVGFVRRTSWRLICCGGTRRLPMLPKSLAIAIVMLAVSPFTQPFSTIKFGEGPGSPRHQRSRSEAPFEDISSAIQDTGATDFPNNPPVDLRPIAGSEGHARLTLAVSPGLENITSAGETNTGTFLGPDRNQKLRSALTCPHAVLRL